MGVRADGLCHRFWIGLWIQGRVHVGCKERMMLEVGCVVDRVSRLKPWKAQNLGIPIVRCNVSAYLLVLRLRLIVFYVVEVAALQASCLIWTIEEGDRFGKHSDVAQQKGWNRQF
jgi:hypothetical protein